MLERGSLHYLPSNPNGCRGIEARMLQDRVQEDVMKTMRANAVLLTVIVVAVLSPVQQALADAARENGLEF